MKQFEKKLMSVSVFSAAIFILFLTEYIIMIRAVFFLQIINASIKESVAVGTSVTDPDDF
jgi:hypothetical protein